MGKSISREDVETVLVEAGYRECATDTWAAGDVTVSFANGECRVAATRPVMRAVLPYRETIAVAVGIMTPEEALTVTSREAIFARLDDFAIGPVARLVLT